MAYHDSEWGVPVHDDRVQFEFLCLEGAQAGLSWQTILRKRENYRKAFDNFDPAKVAAYTDADRERLLTDAGIVRNRLKIDAMINNAQRFLEVQKEFGSFDSISGSSPATRLYAVPGPTQWRTPPPRPRSQKPCPGT